MVICGATRAVRDAGKGRASRNVGVVAAPAQMECPRWLRGQPPAGACRPAGSAGQMPGAATEWARSVLRKGPSRSTGLARSP